MNDSGPATIESPAALPPRPAQDLMRLAAPIVGVMVSRMLMGFVDFAMVSRLGTQAQAAISPASVFVFAVLCAGMGLVSAVQTFASQADGRGERREAGGYLWQSLWLALAISLPLLPAMRYLPGLYGRVADFARHEPAVRDFEVAYCSIALWSFIPATVCSALESFFNGIRKPRITLISVLLSLAINVAGNYALIFGHWGFPAMGIRGAAISTVVAWSVRALVLGAAFVAPVFAREFGTRRGFAFDWTRQAALLRVGGPTAVTWLVDIGSWVVFMQVIIPRFGTVAMAASNVGLQYMHLSFMPAVGLGLALSSQVGHAIGERRPDVARMRARLALKITMAYMLAIGLLFLLARGPLMRLFSDDPAVIAAGTIVLLWAAAFQVFDAMCIVYSYALRGAGDTRWPAVLIAIVCWGVFVCGGYGVARAAPGWGVAGPWMMCTLYIGILGVALALRWRGGAWERIRIEYDPAATSEPADKSPVASPADAR